MKKAIVKYNNGNGALLCNGCHAIIRHGFDHVDTYHYCKECKVELKNAKIDNN